MKACGWIAFIAFKTNKEGDLEKIYFGRNYSAELKFNFQDDFLSIGSEVEGVSVEDNQLYEFDLQSRKLTKRNIVLPTYSQASEVQTYTDTGWDDPDYWDKYCKEKYGNKKYTGDGIIGMSDKELQARIEEVEFEIQEIESDPKTLDSPEMQKKLNDLYWDLDYAYDEMDSRKLDDEAYKQKAFNM